MTITAVERDEAVAKLRELFPRGSQVAVAVRQVSASGMSRAVQVLAVYDDGIADVSWLVRRALGWPMHRSAPGVIVKGAGMDMLFHTVYELARVLHGDGYALNPNRL